MVIQCGVIIRVVGVLKIMQMEVEKLKILYQLISPNRERCDVNKSKFSDQIKKYQTEINNLNNEKEALDQDGLIMDKEISRITNILDDLTQTHNECKRRSLNQQPPAQQPPAQQPLSNYFGYFGEDPPCTNAKYLVKRSWFNLPRDRTLQSNCQIRHANRQRN